LVAQTRVPGTSFDRNVPVTSMSAIGQYRSEILRAMILEANKAAQDLHLQEHVPIREKDIVYSFIGNKKMVDLTGGVGLIDTSNYEYSAAIDRKLSYITSSLLDSPEARKKLMTDFLWPIEKKDTNAVHAMATNFLAAAGMNVRLIERDSTVHYWCWMPIDSDNAHFVPIYWVTWKNCDGLVAALELFQPTKLLAQLRVEQGKYILRKAIIVK
jgi:hypothetical protein